MAFSAVATELAWTGGDAMLGDGKVVILCDGSGSVTNIVAKPTGGEELRITGVSMTFADGATVSLASPASGSYADGSLVFANDVAAEGALTLNRTDGAFPIWSGNRLVGVTYVDAFAANGSGTSDWKIHSAYAVPTDGGESTNGCPHGIYRPIPTNGLTCNRWSGKHTFSLRFQLQKTSAGYIQVRMLTGMKARAGLYLPDTDIWGDKKYRTDAAGDGCWFWYNGVDPIGDLTIPYGGDEYQLGVCRIVFQRKTASMATIGFAGEASMAGTVTVRQGVKMAVMAKANSTFAAPQFSGYGDVEYARDTTLSQANAIVHGTIIVTNATVAVNALGAIPMYCTVVIDNGGVLDFSQATGSQMSYKTDFEVRRGGKIRSYASASLGWWRFDGNTPFRLLGGTLECNIASDRAQNYVYLNRLLMMDGARLKAEKPFWVGNSKNGYWTIGGTGATVDCVQFLSLDGSRSQKATVNVNDGATLVFVGSIAYQPSYPQVDFTKTGSGTVLCQSTCQPTAITDGMKVQDGVWKLGASNCWLNSRPLTLDGGAIAGATNTANTVGALKVGENGGTIELDPGATLAFANSAGKAWSGELIIKGWNEDAVKFGNSSDALTREQLNMIRVERPNGQKVKHLGLDSSGRLLPFGLSILIR